MKQLIFAFFFLLVGSLSAQNSFNTVPTAHFASYSQPIPMETPTGKTIQSGKYKGLPIYKGVKGGYYFYGMTKGNKPVKRYLTKDQKEALDLK